MKQNELGQAVASRTGLSAAQATGALTAAVDIIAAALAAGDSVTLSGFGTFEPRQRAARSGRNPQTGEALTIAASVVPAFKPAAALKRTVAAG